MTTVVYVSQTGAADVGGGGKHRAYQVTLDLAQLETAQLCTISLPDWWVKQSIVRRGLKRHMDQWGVAQLWGRFPMENPYNLLAATRYTTRYFVPAKFYRDYEQQLKRLSTPIVCVLSDTRLAQIVDINERHAIPTVLCSHNLESFDTSQVDAQRKWSMYATAVDFANEFRILARVDERLFTSRVETGLIGGLGLSAHHYPYRPVGLIRQRLASVAQQRRTTQREPGLFLLLGNGNHKTTKAAMGWFVRQAQQHGLPPGIRVIVGGDTTEKLLPTGSKVPGLELRGWLAQAELDELLVQVNGVLVVQHIGFGALTRLPEMACAGIPVISSRHPTYAIDPTPGLFPVEHSWSCWSEKMRELSHEQPIVMPDAYMAWEARQPQPLTTIVKELLCSA